MNVTDRRSRPLEAIYRLSDAVAHAAEIQEVIGAAMDGLIDAVQADRASVLLFDDDRVMRFKGWRGISDAYRAAVEGHTPWSPDEADAHPITITDVAVEPSLAEGLRRTVLDEGIRAMAFIPLLSAGRLIGKFMVYQDSAHEFTQVELQLCQTIASQVAFAIERMRSEESLRRAKDELERRVAERTSELQTRADQLVRLASELTRAEQRERQRLAKVLHDHLQQLLVSAKMSLEAFGMRAGGADNPLIERGQRCLEEAVDVCRSLTVELSPPILHEGGLAGGLEWLARWMQDTHGLTVELAIDPRVDPLREDVRTVVFGAARELLFNVVKHAKVPRAALELSCPGERELCVTVTDEGDGFDPQSVLTRPGAPDTGFGLVEIRERLALMGGRLEVESAPGRGARLTIVMPRGVDTAGAAAHPRHEQAARHSGASSPAVRQGARHDRLRVLVVDDHAVLREGLCMLLLEEPQLEVVGEASDGVEAVERAHALQPDVVLMDFSMPRMNGVEATRRITSELPHVKVIGLSMYDEADRARAMLEAGAVAYLSKNGKARALIELIRARAATS